MAENKWNTAADVEAHIKSAVDALTPDIYDRLDLSVPQEAAQKPAPIYRMYRRMRTLAVAAAACLCIVLAGGGIGYYQNRQVDSVVGIDVNPSIRLSVNRKERILKAEPLNQDAEIILDDMDLSSVDLNIGVNALIGSMVRHGYLDDLDNAILVTVSNSDKEKAATVRREVVTEVASSLEEHKVGAVVYDQEMEETDEIRELADQYGISIGKAYFLKELVEENDLSEEDLKGFAGMNMEEIAREIADRSYRLRKADEGDGNVPEMTEVTVPATAAPMEAPVPESSVETSAEESTEESSAAEESTEAAQESSTGAESTESLTAREIEESVGIGLTEAVETDAPESKLRVRIDNVDFDEGRLSVHFKSKVEWKSPSVSVEDQDGETYSAKIIDTDSESCEIEVYGLDGGLACEFIIGGVGSRGEHSYGSVKGYFDTPEIAEGAYSSTHSGKKNETEGGEDAGEDEDEEETPVSTAAETEATSIAAETAAPLPETQQSAASEGSSGADQAGDGGQAAGEGSAEESSQAPAA